MTNYFVWIGIVEDDEDEDEHAKRRKGKKFKLVLHLSRTNANSYNAACVASESGRAATNRQKMDIVAKVGVLIFDTTLK
ncbi:hypothetical protein MA16_Dca002479 [Dendrobium catenatum]|uniref:Uncharacterized protein n=1 Tax=Dendrobium catenatum TaxID=906689 RepID=A0A2I0W0N0_9ASPA|nr:hypothetical protein MA16_Dca002479 [Dendrobium catenatum]